MTEDFERHAVGELDLLAGPQVLALLRAVQAELGEDQVEGMRGVAIATGVDDGNCHGSAGEMPRPDVHLAVRINARGFTAQAVLVDGDHVAIGKDGLDLRRHVGQVVAGQQRRGQHGPQRKVGAILRKRKPAVAHFQHVGGSSPAPRSA